MTFISTRLVRNNNCKSTISNNKYYYIFFKWKISLIFSTNKPQNQWYSRPICSKTHINYYWNHIYVCQFLGFRLHYLSFVGSNISYIVVYVRSFIKSWHIFFINKYFSWFCFRFADDVSEKKFFPESHLEKQYICQPNDLPSFEEVIRKNMTLAHPEAVNIIKIWEQWNNK